MDCSAECQRISSSVRMTGAGRGNGEPHENFNADVGPLGRTTQYMTRMNWEVRELMILYLSYMYTFDLKHICTLLYSCVDGYNTQ